MGLQIENHGIDLVLDLSDALPKVWGHPHPPSDERQETTENTEAVVSPVILKDGIIRIAGILPSPIMRR